MTKICNTSIENFTCINKRKLYVHKQSKEKSIRSNSVCDSICFKFQTTQKKNELNLSFGAKCKKKKK